MALICATVTDAAEKTERITIQSIDDQEGTINVVTAADGQELSLEILRKAKIRIDGVDAKRDDLQIGQQATITYDPTLSVATKIEVVSKDESVGQISSDEVTPQLLNIEEINSEFGDTSPWLSDDGLTIWWDAKENSGNRSEEWIWTAQRKSPESLFQDKQKVFRGRFPVVSSDGLEIIFVSPDFDGFSTATRKAIGDSFDRPHRISELNIAKMYARPRSLSNDGLTLYFDATKLGDKIDNTWVSKRGKRSAKWQTILPMKTEIPEISDKARFTQVFLTGDGRHLFCTAAFPDGDQKEDIHAAVISRETPDGAFTKYQRLPFEGDTTEASNWRVIRYVESTSELVGISGGRGADLWIIKGYIPPFKTTKVASINPLNGKWVFVDGVAGGAPIEDRDSSRRIVFAGNSYFLSAGDRVIEGTLKFDDKESPCHIDLTPVKGGSPALAGKVQPGIYELKDGGKSLRLCIAPPDGARPTKFDGTAKGASVQTYKKADE